MRQLAAALHDLSGAPAQFGELVRLRAAFELLQQKLAEQIVILVRQLRLDFAFDEVLFLIQ